MSTTELARPASPPLDVRSLASERTLEILERRRSGDVRRRGWLFRRMLLAADVAGASGAFLLSEFLFPPAGSSHLNPWAETAVFLVVLPAWVVVAKLYGLYDRDEERTDHTTADDLSGVFHLVTVGTWLLYALAQLTALAEPDLLRLFFFWGTAISLVTMLRAGARALCRRHASYIQNTVIVGAGDIGQLVARKVLQHPEYGLNVVGFVDAHPRERRPDLGHLTLLGGPDELQNIVQSFDVERVIFAFSQDPSEKTLELARKLRHLDVQIDVVPRLFDLVSPNVSIYSLEALPLVGLPPARLSRSSLFLKRCVDVIGAAIGLVVTAPLFGYITWRIKRDSPGPVLFRQTRLGMGMREFSALKFRTMYIDTDESEHREYIRASMDRRLAAEGNGLFKLERESAITPFGAWLRRTSLDELPQLLNVLRGDMSLVGPRPCIPYETECFEPHHFDRFLVPAGITGLWQVTARARSTFGEALDMDVAYSRGWSLGLDLRLLLLTPFSVFSGGTR